MIGHSYLRLCKTTHRTHVYLQKLAAKHHKTRFVKVDVANVPFLVVKLEIKILPCVITFVDGITKDKWANGIRFSAIITTWVPWHSVKSAELSGSKPLAQEIPTILQPHNSKNDSLSLKSLRCHAKKEQSKGRHFETLVKSSSASLKSDRLSSFYSHFLLKLLYYHTYSLLLYYYFP